MANVKVEQDVVIDRLMSVFQSVGYDGASLSELATATGLQKASLYHRFPGGKQAMANAVLDHVAGLIDNQLANVLQSSAPAPVRLSSALTIIRQIYDGGRLACVLRALSHGTATGLFREPIAGIFRTWVAAFDHLARDFGFDTRTAQRLAESTLIRVQGSLILAQTLQNPGIFDQVLLDIETDFRSQQ
ncbi:MAG: TetR/AcrR family transcriptional regulator [Spirosoma sp.]|nr:TetR/AcrR family transcriptional regulator [Spirosoma sp.]